MHQYIRIQLALYLFILVINTGFAQSSPLVQVFHRSGLLIQV